MSTHPSLGTKSPARAAVTATVMGLLLIGTSFVNAPVVLAASGPRVIAGSKAGPLRIPPKARVVARLALPRGGWLVVAKGLLHNEDGSATHAGVTCQLRLGARVDRMAAAPGKVQLNNQHGDYVSLLLTVAGRLNGAGKALLSCVGEEPGVRISGIQMSAIRAGRLTTTGIGPSATSIGYGKPRIISGRRAVDEVEGDNAYHSVATLPVPRGAWWIVAKAVASASNSSGIFGCRLTAGADYDETAFGLKPRFGPSDTLPLALQVVHRFSSAGQARLECQGPDGFDVTQVVITAVRAGALTNRPLAAGVPVSSGVGWPRVISGWLDGPTSVPVGLQFQTLASMPLPRGNWMILSKLTFRGASVPNDHLRVVCRTALGSGKDPTIIEYGPDATRVAPMVMSLVRTTRGVAGLRLQCVRFPGDGTGDVTFAKLTALKLGSLTQKKL